MLRFSGCAPLFSKLREPRLPMLDEPPPYEPPARASAMAAASARVALRSNAPRMRQFNMSRLDIVPPVQSSAGLGFRRRYRASLIAVVEPARQIAVDCRRFQATTDTTFA